MAWIDVLCKRTGLKRAEAIRRSVRYLASEASKNPNWNWVAATADQMPPLPASLRAELDDAADFAEANTKAKLKADADRRVRPRRTRS